MTALYYQPTIQAHWYALIDDAEHACEHVVLDADIKAYLLTLLQRFMDDAKLAEAVIAMEYLESLQAHGIEEKMTLRNIGDKCLLLTGLFPERVQRRNVPVIYYTKLGLIAYERLSELHVNEPSTSELYYELVCHFNDLVELLSYIRTMDEGHLQ